MRNSDVRNPLMEWICTLSMGQRVAIIIGLFVLASIPQIIHQMFPKVTFRGPMILGFLFYVVVALNVVGYILISFQVNWKATTRNRAALLFSLISVLLFVIAISAMVCFFSNSSDSPKLVMESPSVDGVCTIQVYSNHFSIFEGLDADVYVEWADNPGRKVFLTKIEGSYQLSINWVGNDKVSINGQSFLLRDGIIQKIVS